MGLSGQTQEASGVLKQENFTGWSGRGEGFSLLNLGLPWVYFSMIWYPSPASPSHVSGRAWEPLADISHVLVLHFEYTWGKSVQFGIQSVIVAPCCSLSALQELKSLSSKIIDEDEARTSIHREISYSCVETRVQGFHLHCTIWQLKEI